MPEAEDLMIGATEDENGSGWQIDRAIWRR